MAQSSVTITFRQRATEHTAEIQTRAGSYRVALPDAIPYECAEFSRMLRWKAIGLHDPGDTLLITTGITLGRLLFPQVHQRYWEELTAPEQRLVVLRFPDPTDEYQPLPWELLYLGGAFLLQVPGSHLLRDYGTTDVPSAASPMRILHATFGVDDELELQRERLSILGSTEATGAPVHFLLDCDLEELASACDAFQPTIVHVSGHGYYDDLKRTHYLVGSEAQFPTHDVIRALKNASGSLIFLSTCEGSRLLNELPENLRDSSQTFELVSFTYPVAGPTSLAATQLFYDRLTENGSVEKAVEHIRGLPQEDEFGFFNITHHRRGVLAFSRPHSAQSSTPPIPARLFGGELELTRIDRATREHQNAVLVIPVGGGGRSLLRHWARLQSRTSLVSVTLTCDPADKRGSPGNATYRVAIKAGISSQHSTCTIRTVSPVAYEPVAEEFLMVAGGIGAESAMALLEHLKVPPEEQDVLMRTGLASMPGLVAQVARRTLLIADAPAAFDKWNTLTERVTSLPAEGRVFGALLFGVGGLLNASLLDDGSVLQDVLPDWAMLRDGRASCVRERLAFEKDGNIFLAPDVLIAAEKLFPDWVERSTPVMQGLAMGIIGAGETRTLTPKELAIARLVSGWAERTQQWHMGIGVLIKMASWHFENDLLDELADNIDTFLPHTEGLQRNILLGYQATILIKRGRLEEALHANEEREEWFRSQKLDDDTYRNLIAALTNQIDCLIDIGRMPRALEKVNDGLSLLASWPNPKEDAAPRLLAQKAGAQWGLGQHNEAIATLRDAIAGADGIASTVVASIRHSLAQKLWYEHQDEEAKAQLDAISSSVTLSEHQELQSRVLDLKARMLFEAEDPRAIDYALESYEVDRRRGDVVGVVHSLLFLADLYLVQEKHDLATARLEEATALAMQHRLTTHLGRIAIRRSRVLEARGAISLAYRHLVAAFVLGRELCENDLVHEAAGTLKSFLKRHPQLKSDVIAELS